MALAQLSEMFTALKGKIGGTVFQSYKGLTMVKSRSYAKGKWSNAFQNSKALFSTAASSWRSLTPEERATWNANAVLFPYTNKFGASVAPSGYQLYVTLYLNAISIDKTPLTEAPLPQTKTFITGDECEILGMQTEKVKYTGPNLLGLYVKISISNFTSGASDVPPKHFRAISIGDSSRGEQDITGAMRTAVWGSEFVNGTYWYKLEVVDTVSFESYGTKYIKVIKDE